MDSSWLPIAVPVALFAALFLFKRMGAIDGPKAQALVKAGAKLVDVRSPGEFSSGHIPGAVNVPLPDLGKKADKLGPKDKPVVVYCASGARSAMARSQLKSAGFTQVFNLGPMTNW